MRKEQTDSSRGLDCPNGDLWETDLSCEGAPKGIM